MRSVLITGLLFLGGCKDSTTAPQPTYLEVRGEYEVALTYNYQNEVPGSYGLTNRYTCLAGMRIGVQSRGHFNGIVFENSPEVTHCRMGQGAVTGNITPEGEIHLVAEGTAPGMSGCTVTGGDPRFIGEFRDDWLYAVRALSLSCSAGSAISEVYGGVEVPNVTLYSEIWGGRVPLD